MKEVREKIALGLNKKDSVLSVLLNEVKDIEGNRLRNKLETFLLRSGLEEVDNLEFMLLVALEEAVGGMGVKYLIEQPLDIPIITDGIRFVLVNNVSDTAKSLGVNRSSLSGVLSGARGSVGGWTLYKDNKRKLLVL